MRTDRAAPAPRRILRWPCLTALAVGLLALALPLAQATHESDEGISTDGCAATPGGWGAPPAGHNVGALLHEHFDDIFGDELVVGNLVFDDAQEVTDALPYAGGFEGSFKSNAVALAINIAFGDAGLLDGTVSDVEVPSGPYAGWTAEEILAEMEDVLLSDSSITGREYSDLNTAADNLNNEVYGCHETPDCPSNVMAIPQSNGSIRVTWDEVDDAEEYAIYRATGDSETFVLLTTTSGTEHVDTTTAVGQTYRYKVTAWDGTLESEGCEAVAATAVPFFGGLLLGSVALVGAVGAYRWMRRG